jgi:hypothetical protein
VNARWLFPGTAFAIGVIAFAVGYRAPQSLRTNSTKVDEKSDVSQVSANHTPVARASSALLRDNLRVEGFAKIGFAEMEELLTTASPEQRERWAKELGALPDSPLKPIALIAFYTALVDLKPEEAIRALQKFPDMMYRLNVFDGLHGAVPNALLPQLIEVVSGLSEVERRALLPPYLAMLAQTDPTAAARFIDSHESLVSRSDATVLVSSWARDDVEAATKWLEGSRFFTEPDVLRSLIEAWFVKDPAAAQTYTVLHKDNEGVDEAVTSLAAHLFDTSPEQTREFISRFPDPMASRILMSLVSFGNEDQIAKLTTWASTLPSAVAEDSLGSALARWSDLNPTEALGWLRAKPAAERDLLVAQMIASQKVLPSPEIVALAYKIRDPQKRDETLFTLLQSVDPEAGDVTEQIRAFGLSVPQTKHLLELFKSSH